MGYGQKPKPNPGVDYAEYQKQRAAKKAKPKKSSWYQEAMKGYDSKARTRPGSK